MTLKKIPAPFATKLLDTNAIQIVKKLLKNNYQAYLVGGCVRDLLLGVTPKDFDIVTNARPEQIKSIFKRAIIIGRRFKLVHVLYGHRYFVEVSTFRSGLILASEKDTKIGNKLYGTIEQDVYRRDFTINALYYDIQKHQILDFVDGFQDIQNTELKTIGNTKERYIEDPVRMLRAIRFASKFNLKIAKKHSDIINKNSCLLTNISSSRLYNEVLKLLHNTKVKQTIIKFEFYGLLKYLFINTKLDDFILQGLDSTSARINKELSISLSFFLAIFLWNVFNKECKKQIKKIQKSPELLIDIAKNIIKKQQQKTSFAKYISNQIVDIWLLQAQLESQAKENNLKYIKRILLNKRFRASYDFLLLRANSTNLELKQVAEFWTKAQNKTTIAND